MKIKKNQEKKQKEEIEEDNSKELFFCFKTNKNKTYKSTYVNDYDKMQEKLNSIEQEISEKVSFILVQKNTQLYKLSIFYFMKVSL